MNIDSFVNFVLSNINTQDELFLEISTTINNQKRSFFFSINYTNTDLLMPGGAAYALLQLEESNAKLLSLKNKSYAKILQKHISNEYNLNEPHLVTLLRVVTFKNLSGASDIDILDRSGLFKPYSGIPFPNNLLTEKSLSQIINERALFFSDKHPVVLWGGGIDSNAVVASLVKNNINFSVAFDSKRLNQIANSIKESCFNNINKINLSLMSRDEYNEFFNTNLILTGDCADQLFPGMQHSLDPKKISFKFLDIKTNGIDSYFTEPLPDNIKYMSAREWFSKKFANDYMVELVRGEEFYDSYLAPKIINAPINIQYGYQLKWFLKFIFKYQANATKRFATNFNAFFNSDDFQRWAFTNLETNYNTGCASYLTYKQPLKDYAYSVLNDENILNQYKTHL